MINPELEHALKCFGLKVPKSFSLEETTHDKLYDGGILEFTLDLPHAKMLNLSPIKQEAKLEDIALRALQPFQYTDRVIIFEKCKDGVLHLHGSVKIRSRVYIAGMVQEFVKIALKCIDGRLQYRPQNYYPNLYRYRSPLMCVQWTDEPERIAHWAQYIRKCE